MRTSNGGGAIRETIDQSGTGLLTYIKQRVESDVLFQLGLVHDLMKTLSVETLSHCTSNKRILFQVLSTLLFIQHHLHHDRVDYGKPC